MATKERRGARLYYRRGSDATRSFPDVADAVRKLRPSDIVLDGEIVILEPDGRSSFHRLQQRFRVVRPAEVRLAAAALPACYVAFDILQFEGEDLQARPLIDRKRVLRELIPPSSAVRYADHVADRGEASNGATALQRLQDQVRRGCGPSYPSAHDRCLRPIKLLPGVTVTVDGKAVVEKGALKL